MGDFPEINGYKVVSKLGEGGVAIVYLGFQKKLKRKVAIKVLEPSLSKNKAMAVRFDIEAKTAAMLSHSNIVQIFDIGRAGDYHYIVMEYLEESLGDRIKLGTGGKLHPEIALDICEDIMKALDYAHFRGVFHRDIKPENIMFKQDSTPLLVDFGIASVFEEEKGDNNRNNNQLTASGQSVGTVHYMSPEQCKAQKDIDGRSDIYSLGAVLYEMLTGKKPYPGNTPISISLKHIEAAVPCLPEGLERYQKLIDKMMAKNREKRLSSGPEFTYLLERILTGPDTSSSQPGAGLSPQKEVIITEPPVNRYIDSIDPKLRKFLEKFKNEFLPFKNAPFLEKLALVILFVVFIIVLFIFVC